MRVSGNTTGVSLVRRRLCFGVVVLETGILVGLDLASRLWIHASSRWLSLGCLALDTAHPVLARKSLPCTRRRDFASNANLHYLGCILSHGLGKQLASGRR